MSFLQISFKTENKKKICYVTSIEEMCCAFPTHRPAAPEKAARRSDIIRRCRTQGGTISKGSSANCRGRAIILSTQLPQNKSPHRS